jgi:hypothetical protein
VEEYCDGRGACPADVTRSGQPCDDDGNVCTVDACVGAVCAHTAAPASTVCRPSTGECDPVETCGGSTTCPSDAVAADGAACSDDTNPCTRATCISGSCAQVPGNLGTLCRAAANECDAEELCTGSSSECPDDAGKPNGTLCSNDGNTCTADRCTDGLCTHVPGNSGTVCREAVGECDLPEACDGVSPTCPGDELVSDDAPCSPDSTRCTLDVCRGGICTHPVGNAGLKCRVAITDCDLDEVCDGVSTQCPSDRKKPDGTACIDDGKVCTADECQGAPALTRPPTARPATTGTSARRATGARLRCAPGRKSRAARARRTPTATT